MDCERASKRARGDEAPPGGGASPSSVAAASPSTYASTSQLQLHAQASSRVAAAMAAGGSPFDALPDELVTRIIAKASASTGMASIQ
eukprot:tig00020556_g10993.t1